VRMEELQAAIERGRSAVGPDETQKSDCKP
jgi:hypothetical protein